MKTLLIFFCALLFLSAGNVPEPRTLTGKVTASDGHAIPGVSVIIKGTSTGTVTDAQGTYSITFSGQHPVLVFSFVGYVTQEIKVSEATTLDVTLQDDVQTLSEIVVVGYAEQSKKLLSGSVAGVQRSGRSKRKSSAPATYIHHDHVKQDWNTESYDAIQENIFHGALRNPLSTFSIDVDGASYSNVRRFINNGQRPPQDAVRIEEFVNYFTYDYPQPKEHPFSINTEISTAPWNSKHRLVQIGLQGKTIPMNDLPASNLVFLIDVSGSMSDDNKLPLLKSSFKMLVEELRDEDQISIVVYAGAAGLVLEPTRGSDKEKIFEALDRLEAGGSTAGGAGINLAYDVAKKHFKEGGNNRVILATDGDFNIGASSDADMERLIEEKRKDGIFLTVLGFGMGNYKDSRMEKLSNKGNGNYAYIDNILEARKVLINTFGGTLFTIAKDVKLQVEFNPDKVKAYRLIGYENRMLEHEDFNNDKKDAGELGSGHTVTALYEVIPQGVDSDFFKIDDLKYQTTRVERHAKQSDELMTIKFRYKHPDKNTSELIVHPLIDSNTDLAKTSDNFRWSASVAAFGMLLRESEFVKDFSYKDVIKLAQSARGIDEEGYRIGFLNLVKSYRTISGDVATY
ncbi:MAG TPA: von Willebrand factor type A domain-containing protein [Ohtaekwangia sp.]|nr:von Willebrand factor type A domain-containing protein [Ohtaekwangia sp.]